MASTIWVAAALLSVTAIAVPASAKPAGAIAAAVADAGRPAEDKSRDAARKPAELLAFAGVKPGIKVGELLPGAGYFSRLFSRAVGPRGQVYVYIPANTPDRIAARFEPVAKSRAYRNVTVLRGEAFAPPVPLDLVWTSQNYHDLHLRGGNAQAVNAAVFAALKPGGVYIVSDHRAAAGSGTSAAGTLHRIDQAAVMAEVMKAGFVLEDESMALRRTDDDYTRPVFERRDATDQFVLKFRKPRR